MRLGDLDRIKQDVQDNNAKNYDKQDWTSRQVATLLEGAPTIDPVHAAGGCYCRECERYDGRGLGLGEARICTRTGLVVEPDGWCKWGKLREAQDG